jgi:hypothetical protein
VLERAVENWLAKASERSFQIPFCYMLARQGYTVVHVSSHNRMELGKDVLAIDKEGIPCAFQLKGGDITMRKWRSEVEEQMLDLAYGKVKHPSIGSSERHRPFLVTNGQIDETVVRALGDVNETLQERGLLPIETKVGGELVAEAQALQSNLWPSELVDARDLLELYLHDGRDVFPKEKLASLLESTLPFEKTDKGKPQSKTTCQRVITSAAILTSLVLSSFTEKGNHVAEIEAWTMYVAYVLALAERWSLAPKYYQAEIDIALRVIKNKLTDLAQEVIERNSIAEGLPTADEPFREIRRHWLAALLCVLVLWRKVENDRPDDLDRFVARFAAESLRRLHLWGEAVIPQLLAVYWYQRMVNARSGDADRLLWLLARLICRAKKSGTQEIIPDVYTEPKEWLPYIADQQLEALLGDGPLLGYRLAKQPLETGWKGYSHVLEGLVHLLAQQNWKERVRELWPDVTRINLHVFEFDEPWHFYRWRNDTGAEKVVVPQRTQDWKNLKASANDSSGTELPVLIRQYPILALLFLCVYPHRTNSTALRWLNISLKEAVHKAPLSRSLATNR